MKLYLAALYSSNFQKKGPLYNRLDDRERLARDSVKYNLESYHYVYKETPTRRIREDGTKVFLDSGAFSAYTQGVEIDLPGYVDYIKRNMDIVHTEDGVICASVLDGIGDPLKTWQNQQHMESLGVSPLPCFHYGEDERYLQWYVKNYPYITLGGMVPISKPQLYHWLDRIWEEYLVDSTGHAKIKVHGFGLTTIDLMMRYPWYSVDSSSAIQIGNMGNILIPGYGTLAVSEHSPGRKDANRHITTLPPEQYAGALRVIRDIGFNIDRLKEHYSSRWSFNCWAYGELNRQRNEADQFFRREQFALFSDEDVYGDR